MSTAEEMVELALAVLAGERRMPRGASVEGAKHFIEGMFESSPELVRRIADEFENVTVVGNAMPAANGIATSTHFTEERPMPKIVYAEHTPYWAENEEDGPGAPRERNGASPDRAALVASLAGETAFDRADLAEMSDEELNRVQKSVRSANNSDPGDVVQADHTPYHEKN